MTTILPSEVSDARKNFILFEKTYEPGCFARAVPGRGRVIVAGVDVGSTGAKAVVLHAADGGILGRAEAPTGYSPPRAGEAVLDAALAQAGAARGDLAAVVGTGYGRVALPFADRRVTEITCHARGARHLVPEARSVLDIGGQDSKLIALNPDGSVRDFVMNDKCAAGTGRFIQNMAAALGLAMEDFGTAARSAEPLALSSMCAVFAETEIIGLTAQGAAVEALASGIMDSIARRLKTLSGRVPLVPVCVFTGGLARSSEMAGLLARGLGVELRTPPDALYAGAIGAALIAADGLALSDPQP